VFADRSEHCQQTPGKEPLLAGNLDVKLNPRLKEVKEEENLAVYHFRHNLVMGKSF